MKRGEYNFALAVISGGIRHHLNVTIYLLIVIVEDDLKTQAWQVYTLQCPCARLASVFTCSPERVTLCSYLAVATLRSYKPFCLRTEQDLNI